MSENRRGDASLERLSLNQRTVPRWSLPDLVQGCVAAGVPAVGLWREPVTEYGLARSAQLVAEAGLRVSSLCRGGFLTDPELAARRAAVADNLRAIDEAAELGADTLVLVVGGLPAGSTDLIGAREQVREALSQLAPAARERGVRLGLEALHPMFCADRAVLSTLRQALRLAELIESELPSETADSGHQRPTVGVVVDAYHVWWDPEIWAGIEQAGSRIASYQVCDWILPLPADVLLGRGMMGDGQIDLRALRSAVDAAGYTGDIEVEIFNQGIWDTDPATVLDLVVRRYLEHVV